MSKRISDTIKPNTFTCRGCKKKIEIPFSALPNYGWWLGDQRFCSYSCMRIAEKARIAKMEARNPMAKDARGNPSACKQRLETFGRLVKYIKLRESGRMVEIAAAMAGFSSPVAAQSARRKYERSEAYALWLAEQDSDTEDAR